MKNLRSFPGRVAPPGRPTELPLRPGQLGEPSLPGLLARSSPGFTMVEIAICLAIIGIALIAIIGVLPIGINVQKDNRQETVVDQDASVFMENIRNGARGLNDLTNYVFAITNHWTYYDDTGASNNSGTNYYTYTNAFAFNKTVLPLELTNGENIIGLLSTPKYTDNTGLPLPSLMFGGYSNYVVAYVRSLSGLAVEKPPQNNTTILGDSFSYKMICDNLPIPHYMPPKWVDTSYNASNEVSHPMNGQITYWRAVVAGSPALAPRAGDTPGDSVRWLRLPYPQALDENSHQLRLTFLWPLLPDGNTGPGRHTFATTVAGQILGTKKDNQWLYFFQPQTFSAAP